MNPILLTMHTHAERGQRGLNRKHVNAALAGGELTECSTPLARQLRERGVGTWRVRK